MFSELSELFLKSRVEIVKDAFSWTGKEKNSEEE
jgi:hypothetical protein